MPTSLAALAADPTPGGGLFPGLGINTATITAWIIGIAMLMIAAGALGIISANKHGQLSDVMRRAIIMSVGIVVLAVALAGGTAWVLANQAKDGVVQTGAGSGGK